MPHLACWKLLNVQVKLIMLRVIMSIVAVPLFQQKLTLSWIIFLFLTWSMYSPWRQYHKTFISVTFGTNRLARLFWSVTFFGLDKHYHTTESVQYKSIIFDNTGPLGQIHNTSYSSFFTNGHSKLECFTQTSLSSLVQYNTLAYRAHSKVQKKMNCCDIVLHQNKFLASISSKSNICEWGQGPML